MRTDNSNIIMFNLKHIIKRGIMYKNLRAEIARKGLTKKNIAKEAGLSEGAFFKKLNGASGFTFDEAVKIKRILGVDCPIEYLFADEEGGCGCTLR